MNAVVLAGLLIILPAALIWAHRRRTLRPHRGPQAGSGRRRFRHRRRRQAAAQQARSLAAAIIDCRQDPTVHLAAGVVLQLGEIAWLRARARLAMRSSQTSWVAYTEMSWMGRQARNVSREISSRRWEDYGEIDWLITSQRLVGRLRGSGELISVWWSGLVGVDVDLRHDRLTLNGVNDWIGKLSGPEISPIAVAAVGTCYGPEALALHSALAALRETQIGQMTPPEQSRTFSEGRRSSRYLSLETDRAARASTTLRGAGR